MKPLTQEEIERADLWQYFLDVSVPMHAGNPFEQLVRLGGYRRATEKFMLFRPLRSR